MKRSKKLYTLLGVLVVICLVTVGVTTYKEKKEQIKNSDEIILELDSEKVTGISWEYDGESLAFHKDGKWLYDGDEAFPVNEDKINELLSIFESFGVSFIIEDVEDYGQYGLDDPVCQIQIDTEEDSYQISLGDFSTMDSKRYVQVGDGNVYLVTEDPMESFELTLSDMILHDEIPEFDQINEVAFAGAESYEIYYEENSVNTYCADDVYFTKLGGEILPLDTENVNDYLKVISNLNLMDYETYNASDAELKEFGLDEPELVVTVQHSWENEEGETISGAFVLSVSRDPAEKARMDSSDSGDEEEEITAYARVGESKIVYKLSTDDYKKLMAASYNELRHQEVLSAAFSDIYQIDVSLESNEYTITSKEEGGEKVYYLGEEEIDITDFQSELKGLKATSFTEEESLDKEEISLTVYLDNENYPEVEIQLYRYDGTSCLAVVDGEPVSLVSRGDVVDLIEAVNAIVL